MLEVKRLVTPSAEQFDIVIKGMRLPMKSGDRSDSEHCTGETIKEGAVKYCLVCEKICTPECDCFILGEKDKKLLLDLSRKGASDRKVLRQLPVIMTIKAPEIFWRQMDTYKLGTTASSSSQMHTLLNEPFTVDDFDTNLENDEELQETVNMLNRKRDIYLQEDDPEKRKLIKRDIVNKVPQSFYYTRCWSANYEVLLNIINQRRKHPIIEWDYLIDYWLENVPYLKEINEVIK